MTFDIEAPLGSGRFNALPEAFRDAKSVLLDDAYAEARRLLLGEKGGGGFLVEREQDRKLAKAQAAKHRTFRDAYEAWWAETEADMPKSTRASYSAQLTKRLLPRFGNRLLTEIEPEDIVAFRDNVKSGSSSDNQKPSPSSANMSMSVITALYTYALERGWVKSIPTFQLRRVHETPYSPELTEDEVQALFEAFKASNHPARSTLMLCVITGCRRMEAEGITRQEIVRDSRGQWWWKLPPTRTKQKQKHRIPLIGDKQLEIAQAAADWDVEVKTRRSMVKTLFERERKRLNLPKCGPHAFRHRYITDALENGVSAALLSKRTGQTITVLMGYAGKMTDAVVELTEQQSKSRGFA